MSQEIDKIARREKLKAEGWPATLEKLFQRTGLSLEDCAHMCVDNQMIYMASPEMEEASDKINNKIAPAFNQLGIITYWIYWPTNERMPRYVSELEEQSFKGGARHLRDVWPADIDKVIPKESQSAFMQWSYGDEPTLTEKILKNDNVDILLVTGFHADMCLKSTVRDACQRGYFVVWLEDGSHLREYTKEKQLDLRQELSDLGVLFLESEGVFTLIKKRALQKPTISL